MEMWKPLQQTRLEQRGFRGMRDVVLPGEGDADMPMIIHNMIPTDPVSGGPLVTRPPWQTCGTAPAAAGCQLVYNYYQLDSTNRLVMIADGVIYFWDTSLNPDDWAIYISAATLSGASITLSTTARCYAVTVGGKLVISDGVNTPFMYDGVTATITKLTACPVIYGQPTVYYAKLVAIKNTERSTFVWSEENDPTIGYESGGYNNAWELGQTGSEPLTAILGTNTALYYWRPHSIGAIRGAVTTDFVNDGTHDGVSATVGTMTPQVCLVDTTIYWADTFGRPWYLTTGGDIQPLYPQMGRKFDNSNIATYLYSSSSPGGNAYGDGADIRPAFTTLPNIQIAYYPDLDLVMFGYPGQMFASQGDSGSRFSSSYPVMFACFHHATKSLQAYWTYPGNTTGASSSILSYFACVTKPVSEEISPFMFVRTSVPSSARTTMKMTRFATYALDDDPILGYPIAPPQYVIGPSQGRSDDVTVAFERLDVSVGARPMSTAPTGGRTYEGQLGVALQTSNRQVSSELSSALYSGDAALFPAGGTDQVQTAGNIRFTQNSFGLAEEGRWAKVLIRIVNSVDEGSAFATFLEGWTLTAMARARTPANNIAPP